VAKVGAEIVRLDASTGPLPEAEVLRCLLHEDGFLRVPVLVLGDLLVRGFTEDLYREALQASCDAGEARVPGGGQTP